MEFQQTRRGYKQSKESDRDTPFTHGFDLPIAIHTGQVSEETAKKYPTIPYGALNFIFDTGIIMNLLQVKILFLEICCFFYLMLNKSKKYTPLFYFIFSN